MSNEILWIWSNNPTLSIAVWIGIIILTMYLMRTPAHLLIRSTARAIRNSMRLIARSLNILESNLKIRNKEVILSMGKEAAESVIEREFERVNTVVERDLGKYPLLHRQINDIVNKLEADYKSATETPPSPPAWLNAVESIAQIPSNGDPIIGKVLSSVRDTIEKAHKETLKEYQEGNRERHTILSKMMPFWRKVSQSSNEMKKTIDGLEERTQFIDEQMKHYEEIRHNEDTAAQRLTSSSLTQFFISGLVLIIAIMGGIINFQLIALPMSEMVGGTSMIGPMSTSDVAALVIIMVEIAMGLFLMETLRITHLFPIIGSMDDKLRKRMGIVTFIILFILASVESSLAYMRDILAMDSEAIIQSLSGAAVVETDFRWIPSIGQMVLGFILPFTLAFVAIPLESFIHSLRTVLGLMLRHMLRLTAFGVRIFGNMVYQLSIMAVHFYDMIIMFPLRIERFAVQQNDDEPKRIKTEPAKQLERIEPINSSAK